jgi:flagellar motor switch protein FliN/FliY
MRSFALMADTMDNGEAAEGGALANTDGAAPRRGSAVLGVPIEVVVSVGRARPMIAELVTLRRDSVLPLDSRIEDPVELYIGDRLIARGELQEMDDESGRLAVRLTEVADLSGGV